MPVHASRCRELQQAPLSLQLIMSDRFFSASRITDSFFLASPVQLFQEGAKRLNAADHTPFHEQRVWGKVSSHSSWFNHCCWHVAAINQVDVLRWKWGNVALRLESSHDSHVIYSRLWIQTVDLAVVENCPDGLVFPDTATGLWISQPCPQHENVPYSFAIFRDLIILFLNLQDMIWLESISHGRSFSGWRFKLFMLRMKSVSTRPLQYIHSNRWLPPINNASCSTWLPSPEASKWIYGPLKKRTQVYVTESS